MNNYYYLKNNSGTSNESSLRKKLKKIWNINKHHDPLGELHTSENKRLGFF